MKEKHYKTATGSMGTDCIGCGQRIPPHSEHECYETLEQTWTPTISVTEPDGTKWQMPPTQPIICGGEH